MKNRTKKTQKYKKLVDKFFIQTVALFAFAIVITFTFRSLFHGKIGNFLTDIIMYVFDFDRVAAIDIYFYTIRKYFEPIIIGIIILIFAIFYRIFLSWFTKYFDEMIVGINSIADRGEKINLSPELGFLEDKMNQIKDDLERSSKIERELEKRKNDLIVYLAHDIKTPLTSVIGYLNLLEEAQDMPIEQRCKYVKITLDKAYRLEKLINEFFEITRYNLSSVPMKKNKINLCYMMVQVVDEAYPLLKERQKEVLLNIPEDISIYVDAEKIARVFNNLLKNAIAYSTADSEILISAKCEEDRIVISFKNKGSIPEDKLGVIFDKFSRLDEARQTSTGGAGLGLAISKDIIILHEGEIFAECDKDYTTITIYIPNRINKKINY